MPSTLRLLGDLVLRIWNGTEQEEHLSVSDAFGRYKKKIKHSSHSTNMSNNN
jgi:hypothetical protein